VRFVASHGNDADACTAAAPCRTLQRAVDIAAAGSEVIVLDSGSFGNSLTIGKSITISADGVAATLGNPGNVTIEGAAVVALRGLHLQGVDAGPMNHTGITITAPAAVRIEKCVVERFKGNGIAASGFADAELSITDTIVRDNGFNGLSVTNTRLSIDNSRIEGNVAQGLRAYMTESTISRTVISGHGNHGIAQYGGRMSVTSTTSAQNRWAGYYVTHAAGVDRRGEMTLVSSVARGNGDAGLRLQSEISSARVSNSQFTNNDTGIRNDAGTIETRRNNTVRDNGTDVSGPLTAIPGT
jgi:hypothetical protein